MPKNENTENPKNYRPVTCLPTMYKIITSVTSRRTQKYMDDEYLIKNERPSGPMGPDGLFFSQRTGSHSAGIHELFCL